MAKAKTKSQSASSEKQSVQQIINKWRAQSKIGKAHKILSTVLPLAAIGIILIASAFHWVGVFLDSALNGTTITEIAVGDWLIVIVGIVPLALISGFVNGLLLQFSRINLGAYLKKNNINVKKALNNAKSNKQEEYEISVALLTAGKTSTRALLFVEHGIWFFLQLLAFPFMYLSISMIRESMLTGTPLVQMLFSASNLIVLVVIILISAIFKTVFESIIKNKAKDYLYSKD